MHRLLLTLVLPLLLLLAQQGRLVHAIGHELAHALNPAPVPPAAGLQGQPGKPQAQPAAADKLCDSCLAFGHLAAAAPPGLRALPLPASAEIFAPAACRTVAVARALVPRSRGPPFSA